MTTPTSFDALAIRRHLGRSDWAAPIPFGPDGWRFDDFSNARSIIITCADHNGVDWVHASIAHRDAMPTYSDLRMLHAAVFHGGWAYQIFAPPSDHVNIHEFALHLWGRLDGKAELPDFTRGTGSI